MSVNTSKVISISDARPNLSALSGSSKISDDVSSGGGGNGGGGMNIEARLAKLEAVNESTDRRLGNIESDVREIRRDQRTDFRMLFGALITAALGLAGIIAKGFNWL